MPQKKQIWSELMQVLYVKTKRSVFNKTIGYVQTVESYYNQLEFVFTGSKSCNLAIKMSSLSYAIKVHSVKSKIKWPYP